jgi:lipopolysaccharide export system permease protein
VLIQRYLARAVLLRAGLALPALALVYLGVFFVEQGAGIGVIHLALLRLPLIVVQVAPVALMLGAGLAVVALRGRGELEALASLGASPRRLWAPVLFVGALYGLGALAVDELVVPPCERAIDGLQNHGRAASPLTGLHRNAAWFRLGRWLYNVEGSRVMALELGPGFRPVRRLDAVGDDVIDTRFGERLHRARTDAVPVDWQRAKQLSSCTRTRAEALDVLSLRRRLSRLERAGQPLTEDRLVFHSKLAYPVLNLVVALFACLLFREKRDRLRTPVGIMAKAMGVLLVIWLALATGWILARAGWVSTASGVWGPVAAFGLLALLLLARPTEPC